MAQGNNNDNHSNSNMAKNSFNQSQDLSDLSPSHPISTNLLSNSSFSGFLSPYNSAHFAFEDQSSFQNTTTETSLPLINTEQWHHPLDDVFQNTPFNVKHQQLNNLPSLPGFTGMSPLRTQQFQADFGLNNSGQLSDSPNSFFNKMVNLSPNFSTHTPSRPLLRSPLKNIPINNNSPTAAKTAKYLLKSPAKKKKKNSISSSTNNNIIINKGFTTPLKASLTMENIISLCPNDDDSAAQNPNSSPTTIINSSAVKANATYNKKEEPQSPTRVPPSSSNLQEIPVEPKLGTFSMSKNIAKETNNNNKNNNSNNNTNKAPKFAPLAIIVTNQSTYEQQAAAKIPSERRKQLGRSSTVNGAGISKKKSNGNGSGNSINGAGGRGKLKRSVSQPPVINVFKTKTNELNQNIRDVFRDDQ